MPISSDWDPVSRIWTMTTGETFELSEIFDLMQETDWKGAKAFLWDLHALAEGPDTTAEIRRAVDQVERTADQWSGSRLAVVVERDFDFGIARMFGAFSERLDVEYQVFRDKQQALDWLRP